METKAKATLDDLYSVPKGQKAEIVNGELVIISPTGGKPGRAAMKILKSLAKYEDERGGGYAFGDNVGFIVHLPNRKSFSPDAAWYVGDVTSMDFLQGAPLFAAEVRSKKDYGPGAEQMIKQKVADYIAAGTKVVWDVDLLCDHPIKAYRADHPNTPRLFKRNELANAEPAVPGWTLRVEDLFD